jgi:hypothetical protein
MRSRSGLHGLTNSSALGAADTGEKIMNEDVKDLFIMAAFLSAIVITLIGLVFGINYASEYIACNDLRETSGLQTKVNIKYGCMVYYQGRWVDADVAFSNKQEIQITK